MATTPTNGKAPVQPASQPSAWDLKMAAARRNRTPEVRPAGKSEAQLRDGITASLHDKGSENCDNCIGSGYRDGKYCKCMFNALEYERDMRNAKTGAV